MFGHKPGDRQMDSDFKQYSYCRRCGASLKQTENHEWKAIDERR
jgi:predicted Zn-dependent protease